jgi:RNA 3'-terminal phosphate cyclase (ATP)
MNMERLSIDGSEGEGGGQILRTCLSLSALSGRPFELYNIRAGRSKPGLRPQHLTAVLAAAATCAADLRGAAINSPYLSFTPQSPPYAASYDFNVQDVARGGSAGAVTLILQTMLWPLLFAAAPSTITLRGGTHVPFSPPYHYMAEVARPAFERFGAHFTASLAAFGWYPQGQGEIQAAIIPTPPLQGVNFTHELIQGVNGIAAVTNLPAHIPQRMSDRASNLLVDAGLKPRIVPVRVTGSGPGAGIFLWVPGAGFSALGRRGWPAEQVAETAVAECLAFIENRVAVDPFLADQLLLPGALAHGRTSYTTNRLTRHTVTNAALLCRWLDTNIEIIGRPDEPAQITIDGLGFSR